MKVLLLVVYFVCISNIYAIGAMNYSNSELDYKALSNDEYDKYTITYNDSSIAKNTYSMTVWATEVPDRDRARFWDTVENDGTEEYRVHMYAGTNPEYLYLHAKFIDKNNETITCDADYPAAFKGSKENLSSIYKDGFGFGSLIPVTCSDNNLRYIYYSSGCTQQSLRLLDEKESVWNQIGTCMGDENAISINFDRDVLRMCSKNGQVFLGSFYQYGSLDALCQVYGGESLMEGGVSKSELTYPNKTYAYISDVAAAKKTGFDYPNYENIRFYATTEQYAKGDLVWDTSKSQDGYRFIKQVTLEKDFLYLRAEFENNNGRTIQCDVQLPFALKNQQNLSIDRKYPVSSMYAYIPTDKGLDIPNVICSDGVSRHIYIKGNGSGYSYFALTDHSYGGSGYGTCTHGETGIQFFGKLNRSGSDNVCEEYGGTENVGIFF